MTAIQLTMDDVSRDPEGVRAWLGAHNLRAEDVSATPGPVIRDQQVTAVLYERDDHGRMVVDHVKGSTVPVPATRTVVLPQRVPLPSHLGTVIE